MEKICNAKIKYSFLGLDDNNVLVIQLGFDSGLGSLQSEKIDLVDAHFIQEILNTLELTRWEDLPRKYARIKFDLDTKKVLAVGNLIEEKWVRL